MRQKRKEDAMAIKKKQEQKTFSEDLFSAPTKVTVREAEKKNNDRAIKKKKPL